MDFATIYSSYCPFWPHRDFGKPGKNSPGETPDPASRGFQVSFQSDRLERCEVDLLRDGGGRATGEAVIIFAALSGPNHRGPVAVLVKMKPSEGQTAGFGTPISTYQGNPFWNSGFLSHSQVLLSELPVA